MSKLKGRPVAQYESMSFRKGKMGFATMGTLFVQEDGISFYKAKGALVGQALFGLAGAAATRGNLAAEATAEYSFDEISNAEYQSIMMNPTVVVEIKDGSKIFFSTQSRLFNGKKTLQEAADKIKAGLK